MAPGENEFATPGLNPHFFSYSLSRIDAGLQEKLGLFIIGMNREPSVFTAFVWSPVLA